MEIRVLKYFIAVAEEENITKAARLLHVSQPTLSRQLMQLEQELGVKLFHRSNHSVSLTEEGRLLKRRAQEIVSLTDKTQNELSYDRATISGIVSIGCGETRNMQHLSRRMASFQALHPEVAFEVHTAIADDVKEKIENGILDLGLMLEPVEISRYSFIRMPLRERWCVLMRRDAPLAEKESLTPADLVGVPLISVKRASIRSELDSWFGEYLQQLRVAVVRDISHANCLVMVQNHVGVALAHEFDNCPDDLCFRPLCPEITNGCVLAWKKNQVLSPATVEFIKHMRNTE